jgi:hypothetical protein
MAIPNLDAIKRMFDPKNQTFVKSDAEIRKAVEASDLMRDQYRSDLANAQATAAAVSPYTRTGAANAIHAGNNPYSGILGGSISDAYDQSIEGMKQRMAMEQLYQKHVHGQTAAQQAVAAPPLNPNDAVAHPAVAASLSSLRNMWAAKFGDEWVHNLDLTTDKFWSVALKRMVPRNMLEQMTMPDGYVWFRLLEQ